MNQSEKKARLSSRKRGNDTLYSFSLSPIGGEPLPKKTIFINSVEFEKQLKDYYALRRARLTEALAQQDISHIGYGQMSDDFIKDLCLVRDIEFRHATRSQLVARLQAQDEGRATKTLELLIPVHAPPPSNYFVHHQPVAIYAQGRLVDLPHEVVRNCVLRHLPDADLFSMLFVCKYVQEDALAVLRARAVEQFGPKGSPMALSAKLHYRGIVAVHPIYGTWPRARAMDRMHFEYDTYGFNLSVYANDDAWVDRRIQRTIDKHGSIEGFLRERDRQAQLNLVVSIERSEEWNRQQERCKQANDLLKQHGFEAFFDISCFTRRKNPVNTLAPYRTFSNLGSKQAGIASRLQGFVKRLHPNSLFLLDKDLSQQHLAARLITQSSVWRFYNRNIGNKEKLSQWECKKRVELYIDLLKELLLYEAHGLTDEQLNELFDKVHRVCTRTDTNGIDLTRRHGLVVELPALVVKLEYYSNAQPYKSLVCTVK